jgi:hypothetical protein
MRSLVCVACVTVLALPALARGQAPPQKVATRITAERAEALIREVSATVERLRKLRFKTPVAVEVIDGATARKEFEAEIDDKARESARHTRDAWVQLGLVPEKTDLVAGELDLAETDVLGYYQSGSKTFRLLSHVAERDARSVMAHELTHALEDQHYGLETLQKRATNEDHAVAIRAVIEGSAMVTTLAMMQREGGIGKAKEEAARASQERAKTVRGAPTFVQMRLMLPYTLGFSFLLRGKPWEWLYDGVRMEDVEQAYKDPPRSTREILHPEQYWGGRREKAAEVPLPDLSKTLGAGWSHALTGSIGELGLTMLTGSQLKPDSFEALLPTEWITPGATGNAGECYQHYVSGEQKVTVFLTRWESPRDADEFERSLRLPRATNKALFRVGVNLVVLLGDFGDKGQALAAEATRGLRYWAGE